MLNKSTFTDYVFESSKKKEFKNVAAMTVFNYGKAPFKLKINNGYTHTINPYVGTVFPKSYTLPPLAFPVESLTVSVEYTGVAPEDNIAVAALATVIEECEQ